MKRILTLIIFLIASINNVPIWSQQATGSVSGVVREQSSGETMPGVNIVIEGTLKGTSTDADGHFTIGGLNPGKYNLIMTFISYKTLKVDGIEVKSGQTSEVAAAMSDASIELNDVVIVATKRNDSEVSVMNNIKSSSVVVSGISAQLISRTQDKDASEVVRRLPGVSIVDDRFIVVRGLSSRYNNVWLNNSPAPSLETDTRSFSFDLIPASMIENIFILKSPTAELPADYSGGFIKVSTTGIPSKNGLFLSYGTTFRQYSLFNKFYKERGTSTDWLAAGTAYRNLPENVPGHLDQYDAATNPEIRNRVTEIGRSLNNTWEPVSASAIPDQKFTIGINRKFEKGSFIAGNVTSLTYSYSNSHNEVRNNSYSIYNFRYDTPGILDEFVDQQYKTNSRIGLLHNWTFYPADGLKIEFRNFFTRTGQSRLTLREGRDWYNNGRYIRAGEVKYSERFIYSGQLGAEKLFNEGKTSLDFTAGYSLSSKDEPDLKRYRYINNDIATTPYTILFGNNPDLSSVSRMWLELNEDNLSAALNFTQKYDLSNTFFEFKTGILADIKGQNIYSQKFWLCRLRRFITVYINLPSCSRDLQYRQYKSFRRYKAQGDHCSFRFLHCNFNDPGRLYESES